MMWVYLLKSIPYPKQHYIGPADQMEERLAAHNAGKSKYTSKFKPWKVVVALRFEDDQKAFAFECYLKFGSGHSFANRHFW
jgi:putative endonuclease